MRTIMLIDLHTHTTASDGSLTPSELLARAVAKDVSCLSITDHDSIDAYTSLASSGIRGITLIPGIEFSTTWCGRNIHVLGLNIDPQNPALRKGVVQQKAARQKRAETIASRLEKAGVPDLMSKVMQVADGSVVGRPHFARVLVDEGIVPNLKQSYRNFLGNGKAGDVRQFWASMIEVIDWIRSAGGSAVLAHPGHYNLTNTKLRQLTQEFVNSGGQAIEVSNGMQSEDLTRKLTDLCNEFELLASCGSDFHHEGSRWSDVGKYSPLPTSCRPIWESW